MKIIAAFTVLIFLFLSLLHVYWAFGGKLGKGKVIPQIDGKTTLKPGFLATIAVAAALMVCAIVAVVLGFNNYLNVPYASYFGYAGWVLAGVFILRAVGDFRLIGFFKKVKNTEFARYDSLLYAPLCLILGVALILLT